MADYECMLFLPAVSEGRRLTYVQGLLRSAPRRPAHAYRERCRLPRIQVPWEE